MCAPAGCCNSAEADPASHRANTSRYASLVVGIERCRAANVIVGVAIRAVGVDGSYCGGQLSQVHLAQNDAILGLVHIDQGSTEVRESLCKAKSSVRGCHKACWVAIAMFGGSCQSTESDPAGQYGLVTPAKVCTNQLLHAYL